MFTTIRVYNKLDYELDLKLSASPDWIMCTYKVDIFVRGSISLSLQYISGLQALGKISWWYIVILCGLFNIGGSIFFCNSFEASPATCLGSASVIFRLLLLKLQQF